MRFEEVAAGIRFRFISGWPRSAGTANTAASLRRADNHVQVDMTTRGRDPMLLWRSSDTVPVCMRAGDELEDIETRKLQSCKGGERILWPLEKGAVQKSSVM